MFSENEVTAKAKPTVHTHSLPDADDGEHPDGPSQGSRWVHRSEETAFCPAFSFSHFFSLGENICLSLPLQGTKLLSEYNQTLPDDEEFQGNTEIQGILTSLTVA